jgi:hypothetical protein
MSHDLVRVDRAAGLSGKGEECGVDARPGVDECHVEVEPDRPLHSHGRIVDDEPISS